MSKNVFTPSERDPRQFIKTSLLTSNTKLPHYEACSFLPHRLFVSEQSEKAIHEFHGQFKNILRWNWKRLRERLENEEPITMRDLFETLLLHEELFAILGDLSYVIHQNHRLLLKYLPIFHQDCPSLNWIKKKHERS